MGLPFFGNDFVFALLKNVSNERPYICTHARTIHNVVKVPSFVSVFRMDDGQYLKGRRHVDHSECIRS